MNLCALQSQRSDAFPRNSLVSSQRKRSRLLKFLVLLAISVLSYKAFSKTENPVFDKGNFYVTGGYTLSPAALEDKFTLKKIKQKKLSVSRFGTTTVVTPPVEGRSIEVMSPLMDQFPLLRDFHYRLIKFGPENNLKFKDRYEFLKRPRLIENQSSIGIRLIPIADGKYTSLRQAQRLSTARVKESAQHSERVNVVGSVLLDEYLRQVVFGYEGALASTGPIYAQTANFHPEGHRGNYNQFAVDPFKKFTFGVTHKAAYIGNGFTVNSPENYHGRTWWGYGTDHLQKEKTPYFVHVIDYKELNRDTDGAYKPEIFNRNVQITNLLLNAGVTFPSHSDGYEFDELESKTLNKALNFYKTWLINPAALKTNDEYAVYCAEHTTMSINIALNLPQNLLGYQEVFGTELGQTLWNAAVNKWIYDVPQEYKVAIGLADINGAIPDESLKPLWKHLNLVKKADSWEIAGADEIGVSMGWKPESVGDLVRDFASTYARWDYYGPANSILVLSGFQGEVQKRMNIPGEEFMKSITPLFQEITAHYVATQVVLSGLNPRDAESEWFLHNKIDILKNEIQASLEEINSMRVAQDGVDAQLIENTADIAAAYMAKSTPEYLIEISEALNQRTRLTQLKSSIVAEAHDLYTENIQALYKELNSRPPVTGEEVKTVKYYFSPDVHIKVSNGVIDTENVARRYVKLLPVATIMSAAHVEAATARPEQPFITDSYLSYNIREESSVPNAPAVYEELNREIPAAYIPSDSGK